MSNRSKVEFDKQMKKIIKIKSEIMCKIGILSIKSKKNKEIIIINCYFFFLLLYF